MKKEIDYIKFLKYIKHASVTRVREFIREGANVNFYNENSPNPSLNHCTPLMVATKYKKHKICKILVEHGAESFIPQYLPYGHHSPIIQSVLDDNKELFLYFVDNDNSLPLVPSECFYIKNFTQEWIEEIVKRQIPIPVSILGRELEKIGDKSKIIENILKREKPVLADLKNIIIRNKKSGLHFNYYLDLIDKHVPTPALKELLSGDIKKEMLTHQRDLAVYDKLQIILQRKILEHDIGQNNNKKVFKM